MSNLSIMYLNPDSWSFTVQMQRFSVWIVVLSIHYNTQVIVNSIKTTTLHKINDSKINFDKYIPNFKPESLNPERRIVGGTIVNTMTRYPYMAYLLRITHTPYNSTWISRYIESCGATILDRTHVLTSAHCVKNCFPCNESVDDSKCPYCEIHSPHDYVLFFGSTVANNSNSISTVKNVFIHPGHKFVSEEYWCVHRMDVAVLELSVPLNFSSTVQPVRLPKAVTLGTDDLDYSMTSNISNEKWIKDRTCVIVGWGLTSQSDKTPFMQERLQVARVPVIRMDRCVRELMKSRYFQRGISRKVVCQDTNICSKSLLRSLSGICYGDSGGPILCAGMQLGVTSWTVIGCVGPHIPNVYTRVDVSLNWINDVLKGS